MTDATVTNLTIRRIDPAAEKRLRVRAAQHGRSMEEEARRILGEACGPANTAPSLADLAHELLGATCGAELELPTRQPVCEPPDLP